MLIQPHLHDFSGRVTQPHVVGYRRIIHANAFSLERLRESEGNAHGAPAVLSCFKLHLRTPKKQWLLGLTERFPLTLTSGVSLIRLLMAAGSFVWKRIFLQKTVERGTTKDGLTVWDSLSVASDQPL